MALITKTYTFSAGASIVASEHNSNFDTIYNEFNGSISNANISTLAAISDSKFAQITTAGKVSGAALTTLGSIPSGGGVVPIANLATGTPDGTKFIRDDGTLQSPVNAATQAQMESASSTVVSVTPGRQHYHPGMPKAWAVWDGTTTGTHAVTSGYNITNVTRNGTGDYTVTFDTAFSSANIVVTGSGKIDTADSNGDTVFVGLRRVSSNPTTTTARVIAFNGGTSSAVDAVIVSVVFWGDQ